MADERGRKQVVLIGAAVAAIAPIGYVFIHSIPGMMAWRTFHGLSIAAFTTGYSALVVDLAPEKNRGEIIGYMSLVIPLGMSIGPILGGYLQETAGYATVFWVAAICGCMALFFANRTQEKSSHVIQDGEPGLLCRVQSP